MRAWHATVEPPVTFDYRGLTVCKTGPGARALWRCSSWRCSSGFDVADLSEEQFVHVVTECAKLAFADRDAAYGDALAVPIETLLSAEYNDQRRKLVTDEASDELRPGLGRLPRSTRQVTRCHLALRADAGRHGSPRRR